MGWRLKSPTCKISNYQLGAICLTGKNSSLHCMFEDAHHQVTMKISDPDLQEFVAIYQEEIGETLSLVEASEFLN